MEGWKQGWRGPQRHPAPNTLPRGGHGRPVGTSTALALRAGLRALATKGTDTQLSVPPLSAPQSAGGSKGLKGRHSQDRERNLSLYVTAYLSSNVLARVKCVRGAPRRGAPTGGVRRPPASSLTLACHVLSSILKFCLSAPLPLIQGGFWQYFIKCVKVNNR